MSLQTFDALGAKYFRPTWGGGLIPKLGMFLAADGGIGFAIGGVLQFEVMSNGDLAAHGIILGADGAAFLGGTSGMVKVTAPAIAAGTLVLPNGPDTLVGRASTDTLTHKSIDGTTNTLINLPGAKIVPPFVFPVRIVSDATNPVNVSPTTDFEVCISRTGSSFATSVVLPTLSAPSTGQLVRVTDRKGDANANPITVSAGGGNLINGAATDVINTAYGSRLYRYAGQWNIVGRA